MLKIILFAHAFQASAMSIELPVSISSLGNDVQVYGDLLLQRTMPFLSLANAGADARRRRRG